MMVIIKVKSERFVRSISFTLLLLCSSYGDVHAHIIILCLQVADCVLVHVSFTLGSQAPGGGGGGEGWLVWIHPTIPH